MNKGYYYRVLGLRDGASQEQIKAAYSEKCRKLKSEDYADDPEYVEKKLGEVRHAYSVLTGRSAPATKAQKEARFEKWKDALDGGEDTIEEAKKSAQKAWKKAGTVFSSLGESMDDEEDSVFRKIKPEGKKTYYAPHEKQAKGERDRKIKNPIVIFIIVIVAVNVISGLVTGCTALFEELTDDGIHWDISYNTDESELDQDTVNRIEEIYSMPGSYDYDEGLDLSTREEYQDQVEWDVFMDSDTYNQLWGAMTDLAYGLGLYNNGDAVAYITGDADAYWENDDYFNAQQIASIMYPPDFEEVAGATNLYNDEVILNYADYLYFLRDVAERQTEDLL